MEFWKSIPICLDDKEGLPRKFGSRRHYCFSHQGYREECVRIVTLVAERYGANPYIGAWQTDNGMPAMIQHIPTVTLPEKHLKLASCSVCG